MNSEKIHSGLTNTMLIILASPILFAKWLLLDGKFGHAKAIVFVVLMFIFGSVFFIR